ncbi:MAG: methyltransferase domain-containing protein [Gemmatimonadota bacterium]|nr:methyltransferase domain-containing protein [Gemmatimonadota bacterium]MDH5195843.1 methyltransferase domain-containing protein [Gemmatimonadota bacterium]
MIRLEHSPLGVEALDDGGCPDPIVRAMLPEIARANTLFGGRAAAMFGAARLLDGVPAGSHLTLLDVGAGRGDLSRALVRLAGRRGIALTAVALDNHRVAAALARGPGVSPVLAGAEALPIAVDGVDLVLASQFLHHFSRPSAAALVREFDRLARVGVVICEPRRTPLAAAGIWAAAQVLGFHAVTRRDGVLSVRRSFTPSELAAVLADAGVSGMVQRRWGFRVVAWWRSARAHG